jgi:hypothetical protein
MREVQDRKYFQAKRCPTNKYCLTLLYEIYIMRKTLEDKELTWMRFAYIIKPQLASLKNEVNDVSLLF